MITKRFHAKRLGTFLGNEKDGWLRPTRPASYQRICGNCLRISWVLGKEDYTFCPWCGIQAMPDQEPAESFFGGVIYETSGE